MITRNEILMGRDKEFPIDTKLEYNLELLLKRLNHFEVEYWNFSGRTLEIASGYRPDHYNREVGGSLHSAHLTCEAVDLADSNKAIKLWIVSYSRILDICDLYMEDPKFTPHWCHLSTRAASRRIFIPYSKKI